MNFDKFKELKPKQIPKTSVDNSYFEELDRLKPRQRKGRVLSVIGTVAAAITIIAVVSVWAILGSGIRLSESDIMPSEEPFEVPSSIVLHEREITDELFSKLNSFYSECKLFMVSDFDRDNPLSKEQLITLCEAMEPELRSDLILTKNELQDFAYDMFRYEIEFDENIKYDSYFMEMFSLAAVDFVSYKVSDSFKDGTQLAQVEIQSHADFRTVRFIQRGDLLVEFFISMETDDTKKAPTLEQVFESIATKYRFDGLPTFELDSKPDFLQAKYHIAKYLGKDSLVEFKNTSGYGGYGIPLDLFKSAANEIYGGISVGDDATPIEEVNTVKLDRLNLIDMGDNELIVPLEATGGLEVESYKFIEGFGFEYQSQSAFRIVYEVTYKGTEEGPQRYEVSYVRSNNKFGLYPTKIIAHKQL